MDSNRPNTPTPRQILETLPLLNIGGHPISVRIADVGIAAEPSVMGLFIPQAGEIIIDGRQTDTALVNTLVHEILHACFHTSGVDIPDGVEEDVVRVITSHLFGVFMLNPRLAGLLASTAVRTLDQFDGGVCAICSLIPPADPEASTSGGQARETAATDPGPLPVVVR